ncbi:MAG: sigma-70 family RNA polymerase sigma factor [Clostridiales bacterium]|nr:sigma-70 family RNA polymerase sigma factor [Clostridiales bacterium]
MLIEELIAAYGNDILRLCIIYLGDLQLAQDAFQETFVKAWKGLDAFRGDSSPKTWLSHIAVNTCRDMLRSGWLGMLKRSKPIEEIAELALPAPDPEAAAVREATLRLSSRYREVIVLYYYQGMQISQIAQTLSLPENTVSTRLRRARAQLKRMLGEEVEP